MNNIVTKSMSSLLTKDVASFIKETGKYGCILVGIVYVSNLIGKAIDNGYSVELKVQKDGVSLNLNQPHTV